MQNSYFVTQNKLNRKISGFSAWLLLAAALAVLVGCGSGQAIPSFAPPVTDTGGTPATPTAATLQLLTSNTQIDTSGTKTVDLTAVVLGATKQALAGRTVTFTAPPLPETAFINNISASGVSDTNGIVTAKLNLGGNKLNRNITISAQADSASASNNVLANGTTLTVGGNTSLALGNTTTLTFSLKDSSGSGIQNISLTINSKSGNPVCVRASLAVAGVPCPSGTPATATSATDSAGQLIVDVDAKLAPGNVDTLNATINDPLTNMAPLSTTLNITSATFVFQKLVIGGVQTDSTDILIGTTQMVAIKWTDPVNGVPAGTKVNFSTTRGTITNLDPADCVTPAAVAVTDATGRACMSITSGLAGPAIVTAVGIPTATSPAATQSYAFVSRTVANVTVQAIPGTVAVTTTPPSSQTNNTSLITATVRDGNGVDANLVKNAGITFTLTDQTGGRLSSGTARTDDTGSASVTYTAGTISSAANGVTIKATVTDVTNASPPITPVASCTIVVPGTSQCQAVPNPPEVANFPDAALTVANQPLLVRLGTDSLVGGTAPNNQKTFSAVVTDAAGNASIGTTVRFSLRPSQYAKGYWALVATQTATVWKQYFTVPSPGSYTADLTLPWDTTKSYCLNEDVNFNGILDPLEDFNGNGTLDPGGVATVTPSAVTDANGIATAVITYPKDHSYWTRVTLEARTGVVGNDPPTSTSFWLTGPATDYIDSAKAPPGQISPYGTADTCANPN